MKDMERSLSRTEWREAATGGLYAGLAYALLTIAAHAGRSMPGLVTILNAVSFFSFAGFLYFYARRNPLFAVFSGIFSMLIYGGLLGLLISIFVRRPADPFGGGTSAE